MASSSATGSSTEHDLYAKYEVPKFENEHLGRVPELMKKNILERYKSNLSNVENYSGNDRPHRCKQIAELLTSLGGYIYCNMDMKPLEIVSLDYVNFIVQNHVPKHHPYRISSKEKPDIVAKGETAPMDSEDMPWHRIESVVTIVDSQSDFRRAVNMTCRLLEARPDFPGAWGLAFALSTMEYRIFWADAAGLLTSKWYTHSDGWEPLMRYLYSFYRPPPKHLLRDPSIQSCDNDGYGRPKWTVRCGQDQFQGCRILHCADVFHGRTMVYEYRKGKEVRIIKDSFWKNKKYQPEGPVLEAIHKKGALPGVVGLHHHESVVYGKRRARILTPPSLSLESRTVHERSRMVMTSTGVSLLKAKSVKDLLMAVYDIIEAHRCLVVSRDILHRDMSANNILMYPEHSRTSKKKAAKDAPTFIATVLEEDSDEPKGLIIDFDNATTLRKDERRFRVTSDRDDVTGTPHFLARSSSACAPLKAKRFVPMPVLTGVAKDRYVGAYSQATYDAYTDCEDTWHGVPRAVKHRRKGARSENYLHRPDHDVETTFWSFAHTSMQLSGPAKRKGGYDEPLSDHALFTWTRIRGHTVNMAEGGPLPKDSRDVLLAYTEDDWKEALHPTVACLAPLLVQMARQIFPEYGLLVTPPPQEHLHEALRRLLLAHIVAMEDPGRLDPWGLRDLPRKVDLVDLDDTSNWRPHWILPAEGKAMTPVPEEERPKIVLRVPKPDRVPLPRKRRAEGEPRVEEQKDGKSSKSSGEQSQESHGSPVQSKRRKLSH